MQQKVVRVIARGRQVIISNGHSRAAKIISHAPVCLGANRMLRSNYCNNRISQSGAAGTEVFGLRGLGCGSRASSKSGGRRAGKYHSDFVAEKTVFIEQKRVTL